MGKHKKSNKLPHPKRNHSSSKRRGMCLGEEGGYKERTKSLNILKYGSYKSYLQGKEWCSIRKWVVSLYGGRCSFCTHDYNEIHHAKYDVDTLVGNTLHHLHPVCHDCHQYGEFDFYGNKHSPEVATQHMIARCKARFGDEWWEKTAASREEKHTEWLRRNKI